VSAFAVAYVFSIPFQLCTGPASEECFGIRREECFGIRREECFGIRREECFGIRPPLSIRYLP